MATILVADDDPISQRMLGVILGRLGHTVVRASNGQDALNQLDQTHADLLILDFAMPIMDGVTALRKLRADERFATLPIIMLTASGLERDERTARAEGVSEFLTKPFRSQELVDRLDRLLRQTGG
ncbi:MAG: response regulator [Chloroflexi bacterium]|nr:response regulator [Chloroflexota bacterium]